MGWGGKGKSWGKSWASPMQSWGKSFGKGWGKSKGKGKGKFTCKPDRKVWIGGLSKEVTRGKLVHHFKETVKPAIVEIMGKGSACISFKTAEDAETAISVLNGSELEGKSIEVDVWTKKEKKERQEGEERPKRNKKKNKHGLKTSFLKGGKKTMDSKMKEKLKEVDHSLKLWVGGLSKTTTWKQLKTHFTELGCEVDIADLMKPGTACVTFKTEDEATTAVGIANGTELEGKTLEVDVWKKPERKSKVKKEED